MVVAHEDDDENKEIPLLLQSFRVVVVVADFVAVVLDLAACHCENGLKLKYKNFTATLRTIEDC